MKKFVLAACLMLGAITFYGQIQIVSGTDWKMGLSQNGPFNLTPHPVTFCVDEGYIDSLCGDFYGSPMLKEHFADCPDMVPIWGTASPAGCYFDPYDGYWFQKIFFLDLDDCHSLEFAIAQIQADQRYELYINGVFVDASVDSEWDVLFGFDVTNLLVPGYNDIRIKASNIGGGSCFNYAFMAFCLDISLNNEFSQTAAFNQDLIENNNDFSVVSTAINQSQGLEHNWMVLWGDSITSQTNFYGFWGPETGASLVFDPEENFDSCRYFRTIHRIFLPGTEGCEACESIIVQICPDDNAQAPQNNNVLFNQVDCDIIRQYVGTIEHNMTAEASLMLLPNPAVDDIRMQWSGIAPTRLVLRDAQGRLLATQKVSPGQTSAEWNLSQYPAGFYTIELQDTVRSHQIARPFVIARP